MNARPSAQIAGAPAGRALWAAAGGLLALHVTLAWLTRPAGVETGHDDAQYLLLARSLRGLRYQDLFLAGTPTHAMYPPGYPVLLAFWGALVGNRFDLLTVLGMVSSAAGLGLVFLVLMRVSRPAVALLCLAALSVNPFLVENAGLIASEAPYQLLSLLALWILARQNPAPRLLVVAGAAAIGAALTRSAGVTLLVAIGIHWLVERRYVAVATLGSLSAATVGIWLAWTVRAPQQFVARSYVADVLFESDGKLVPLARVLWHRALENVPHYLGWAIPYRLPMPTIPGTPVDNAIGAAVTVLGMTIGLVVFFRRWRPAALYVLCYAALLAVWPWYVGRFIHPVLPLLVPAVVMGFGTLARRLHPAWGPRAMLVLALVLIAHGLADTVRLVKGKSACERTTAYPSAACLGEAQRQDQVSFFAALEYVTSHLSPDARVATGKPATLYYYTGRTAVMPQAVAAQDPAGLLSFLRRNGVRHVLLGNVHWLEPTPIAGLLEANCHALRVEATFPPHTYLFRIADDGEVAENGVACAAVANYLRRVGRSSPGLTG